MSSRTLKIESRGDFAANKIHPAIRIKGNWPAKTGFAAGNRVQLVILASGLIQLKAITA
jgi:hypothetical protein